jgi:ribonucleoside-diphosphate reductase alpha chain
VPLEIMADKLSHMRFDPSGFTANPEIPMAKSIVDYVVRWLSSQFLTEEEKREVGIITQDMREEARAELDAGEGGQVIELPVATGGAQGQTALALPPTRGGKYTFRQDDGVICGSCGWTMIRSGTCYKCENCGSTSGCS